MERRRAQRADTGESVEEDGALAEFVRFVERSEDVLSARICDEEVSKAGEVWGVHAPLTEACFGETDEESHGVEALVGRHLVREECAETPDDFKSRDPPPG